MKPLVGPALVALRTLDRPAFLSRVGEVYSRTRSVPKAAQELGVGERTIFRWLQAHPELKREATSGRSTDKNGKPKQSNRKEYSPPTITLLDKDDPRVALFRSARSLVDSKTVASDPKKG